MTFRVRCSTVWLVLAAGLPASGAGGSALAQVVMPPLAATLIGVCRDQPCLTVASAAAAAPPAASQARSRKRLTRRPT